MITTIVSGAQTGADQAGLRAAKKLGLKTGGYAPKGFKTECGLQAWLGPSYNLTECASDDHWTVTELNVTISNGTVIFGTPSSVSDSTIRICRDEGKPYLWLTEFTKVYEVAVAAPKFRLWVERNDIRVLNCSGNRESRNKGIGIAVEHFLVGVLPLCH